MKKDYTPIFGFVFLLGFLAFCLIKAGDWSEKVSETSDAVIAQRDSNERKFNKLSTEVKALQRNRSELERFVSEWQDHTKIKSSIFAGSTLTDLSIKHPVAATGDVAKTSSVPFRSRNLDVYIIGKEITGPFFNVISYLSEVAEIMPQVRYESIKIRHVKGSTVSAEFSILFPNLKALGTKEQSEAL